MKQLFENIKRIKVLMEIDSEDEQLSLFANQGSPININSDEFTKKFKEKVYFILKDLYKSNWSSDRTRGPRGGGGVVGVYTVYDLLKEKGLDDYDEEGGDWSILNYFDTNPQVRKRIVGLYEKETGNIMDNTGVMEDFIKWMSKNRYKIFKNGSFFNDLIKINVESLYQGELNERKAYDFLSGVLKNLSGWKLKGRAIPGSRLDREGVDFIMINEKTGKEARFQVKPLSRLQRVRDFYRIKSYNIKGLDRKPVDYFVFASSEKNNVFIFKNTKGKYAILDKDTVQFEEPPVKF